MQREIAEQLKLPKWVMEMFDKQDEEDDFNGLEQGSRSEIAQVVREVYQTTQNRRFLWILHNGSLEVLDLFDFGIFLDRYTNSKMLWTFQGRFRLDPKMIDDVKKASRDVILSAEGDVQHPKELWLYLVHHEAAEACCNKHGYGIIDPAIAAECVLYMLKQSWTGSHVIDYDWAIHTSNYWVCTEIIALTDLDEAWEVADVLQGEVRLLKTGIANWLSNGESTIILSSHLARSAERMPYWIWNSPATCGFVQSRSGVILDSMFQHSHRLGVLKLSRCTFSFSSPPFLCCHSLRFLWLDHCKDLVTRSTTDQHHIDAHQEEEEQEELDNSTTTAWECFQSLWVLDLRYTDWDQILSAQMMDFMTQVRELNVMGAKNWDMSHLRGWLRNIRKLRVTKSTCCFNNNVLSEMESLELLDFSGNTIRQGMTSLSVAASNSNLKTVIIDGCDGLKVVSLRGCKELRSLFFKGLFQSLEELDLSGTKVKTLDLREVEASSLPERITLLGCEELRVLLWPQKIKEERWRGLLRVDTTSTSASADEGEAPHAHPHGDVSIQQQKEEKFKGGWQITLTDTRLLRSLSPVASYLEKASVHIDISSAAVVGGSNVQGTSSDKLMQVQPHTSAIIRYKYHSRWKIRLVSAPRRRFLVRWLLSDPNLLVGRRPASAADVRRGACVPTRVRSVVRWRFGGFQSLCAGVLELVIAVLVPSTPSLYRAPTGVAAVSLGVCSLLVLGAGVIWSVDPAIGSSCLLVEGSRSGSSGRRAAPPPTNRRESSSSPEVLHGRTTAPQVLGRVVRRLIWLDATPSSQRTVAASSSGRRRPSM